MNTASLKTAITPGAFCTQHGDSTCWAPWAPLLGRCRPGSPTSGQPLRAPPTGEVPPTDEQIAARSPAMHSSGTKRSLGPGWHEPQNARTRRRQMACRRTGRGARRARLRCTRTGCPGTGCLPQTGSYQSGAETRAAGQRRGPRPAVSASPRAMALGATASVSPAAPVRLSKRNTRLIFLKNLMN